MAGSGGEVAPDWTPVGRAAGRGKKVVWKAAVRGRGGVARRELEAEAEDDRAEEEEAYAMDMTQIAPPPR